MTLYAKDGTSFDPVALVREIPFKHWIYREAIRIGLDARTMYARVYRKHYIMPERRKINSRVILVPARCMATKRKRFKRRKLDCHGLQMTNRKLYFKEYYLWRKALANLWVQAAEGVFGLNK